MLGSGTTSIAPPAASQTLRERAKGRWREILATTIDAKYLDGKHHECPHGEGTDRFRFSDRGYGAYFCACSDGGKDGFDLLQCALGCDFRRAAEIVEAVVGKADAPRQQKPDVTGYLLRISRAISRSHYLASRGLETPPSLLWANKWAYREEGEVLGEYPVMVGPIHRGELVVGCHVTYLGRASKADVPQPRKIMPPRRSLAGGAVRLYPAAETLGIAEGIETAIAAHMLHDMPVWAALNTSLLSSWEPPPSCKNVVIFGDHDANYAGQAAAYALAKRLAGRWNVEVRFPPAVDTDWNDVLLDAGGLRNGR